MAYNIQIKEKSIVDPTRFREIKREFLDKYTVVTNSVDGEYYTLVFHKGQVYECGTYHDEKESIRGHNKAVFCIEQKILKEVYGFQSNSI